LSEISHTTSFWHIDAVGGRPHQQIGDDRFTWFGTRASKSRLNFLDLLRAGHTDYVLNDAAYGYVRSQGLPATTIAHLKAQPEVRFDDTAGWLAHLDRLGD
jgi:hypothetical protein